MANKTNCDALVYAKRKIANAVYDDANIVALIVDNPQVVRRSAEYATALDYILDYRYIDETIQEAKAWVLIETEWDASYQASTGNLNLYVEIVCSKRYMSLKGWRGYAGNRRDNIMMLVDKLLRGSRDFGIGKLECSSVSVTDAPNGFSSILLRYTIPEFTLERGNS